LVIINNIKETMFRAIKRIFSLQEYGLKTTTGIKLKIIQTTYSMMAEFHYI